MNILTKIIAIINITTTGNFPNDIAAMLEMSDAEIVEIIYLIIFFIVGTPINAYAFSKSIKIRRESWSEQRLVRLSRHLLIAHLMVLCIYCLWRTFWFVNVVWTLGNFSCKFYSFLTTLPFHLWSNMVAAIAVDMYFCLTSPLHSVHKGHSRVTILILFAWGFAIFCSLPMMIFRGIEPIVYNNSHIMIDGECLVQCMHLITHFDWETIYGFSLFHVLTTFYVPLIIIVVSYFLIGLSLREQIVRRATLRSDSSKLCKSTQTKFLKATIAIIITFVFTWLPYQVVALLQLFCADSEKCQRVLSKVHWVEAILLASTCINPFLYKFNTLTKRPPVGGNSSFQESERIVRSHMTSFQSKTTYINRSQTFNSQMDGKIVCNILMPNSHERRSLILPSTRIHKQNSLNLLPGNSPAKV